MDEIRALLMDWYAANRRELPWRETTDAYRIWVSEIILQQTRVAQGYDYFLRFMRLFPDVHTLASASEDEVMKAWQGLGYYSRARNLHAAARTIAERHNGRFPDTYAGVRALKGVGDYTAAAICSFAYGQPCAVVDGNVYRVISRIFGIETPIDTTAGHREFAALADSLLDRSRPGDFNQAMMDFGAIQCVPHQPDCRHCPMHLLCTAAITGRTGELPVKQHRTRVTGRFFNYIYVRAGAYTYLRKRTGNDIWRNLYEFPLIETQKPVGSQELLRLLDKQQWIAEGEEPICRCVERGVKHVLSHRIIHADFYELRLPASPRSFPDFLQIRTDELGNYPVSRLIDGFLKKNQEILG